MENLPSINGRKQVPVSLPVEDYLLDHVFNGQAILPAVEGMRILAEPCLPFLKNLEMRAMVNADFTRFLNIEPGMATIEAIIEMDKVSPDIVSLKLLSKIKPGKSGITRTMQHASLSFIVSDSPPVSPPIDCTLGLEGICMRLEKDRIYSELIPFKHAYQNIENLFISEQGALAKVKGGTDRAPYKPLGSPFPLDASFHAACVWGQRFAGVVGFPVHIDRRSIIKKTVPGNTYTSRITPVDVNRGLLIFDLWIYDAAGELCEEVRGLHMKDVSGNTLKPPQWILDRGNSWLDPIRSRCKDFSVIELATITSPCAKILSPPEQERFNGMREKRGKSFLAARLALKRLSRRISGDDIITQPETITTMKPDGRPCCPLTNGAEVYRCTASHDSRFAIAAVSDERIGIDVEEISGRVLKSRQLYMHEEELLLVKGHKLGEMEASARVWTIKEAVSKASGFSLAEAWQKAKVKEISGGKSTVTIEDQICEAIHVVADGHLFTLITMP